MRKRIMSMLTGAGDNLGALVSACCRRLYKLKGRDAVLVPAVVLLTFVIMVTDVGAGASVSLRPLFFAPAVLLGFVERRVLALSGGAFVALLAVESFMLSQGFDGGADFFVNFAPALLAYLSISELMRYFMFVIHKLHSDVLVLQDMLKDVSARQAKAP